MRSSLWLLLLALPMIVFVLSLLVGVNGLGCSEYAHYRSEACVRIESVIGTDLYWLSTIVGIFALPISLVTAPVFMYFGFRTIFRKRAKA